MTAKTDILASTMSEHTHTARSTIVSMLLLSSLTLMSTDCKHSTDPPIDPSYHNKILFTSRRSGMMQLYMMNPDGSEIQQITNGNYSHWDGRWSRDAKKIICNTDEIGNGEDMVIVNVDGSYRVHIGFGIKMAWSPSGDKILYMYCPGCEGGVLDMGMYICDRTGANAMRLSLDGGLPDWAPDGKQIVYGYSRAVGSGFENMIRIVDYPGFASIRNVFTGRRGNSMAWSPSGLEVAFGSSIVDSGTYRYQADLFVTDTSGRTAHPITNHLTLEHFLDPRWSPDGSQLIFISYVVDGSGSKYLYIVDRDGTNLRKMLSDSTVSSGDWSW
jgi:Tol biopolymer transport system component